MKESRTKASRIGERSGEVKESFVEEQAPERDKQMASEVGLGEHSQFRLVASEWGIISLEISEIRHMVVGSR